MRSGTARCLVIATGEAHSVRELCEESFGHVGLDYKEFAAWNKLENPNLIRVGQVPARWSQRSWRGGSRVRRCEEREETSPHGSPSEPGQHLLAEIGEELLLLAQVVRPGLGVPDLGGGVLAHDDDVAVQALMRSVQAQVEQYVQAGAPVPPEATGRAVVSVSDARVLTASTTLVPVL